MSTNTYTQLRDGSWGVRVSGTASAGEIVTVTKKSGETKTERIGRVLWSGRDSRTGSTISLCSIANATDRSGRRNGKRSSYGCRNGECYCPECSTGSECLCRCSCGFGG